MWNAVQGDFEFPKVAHIFVVAKMLKPFLEIEEYYKDHFAYFYAFLVLVINHGKLLFLSVYF